MLCQDNKKLKIAKPIYTPSETIYLTMADKDIFNGEIEGLKA